LTVKTSLIFGKRFTVFKTVKLFSGFKLFILACTFVGIHYRWALEFVGSPNLPPKVLEFWYLIARIWQPLPKSGNRRQNSVGVGIWKFLPESGDVQPS
jgi:hypothetical protein